MTPSPNLYFATGRLTVAASGYWFTSGGEKGSFGYYPHLKDLAGFPVFPDTQVAGNLRMASKWLEKLGTQFSVNTTDLFGDEPGKNFRQIPSRFFCTDLALNENAKKQWGSVNGFDVKARICMDDENRVNQKQMLVNLELAFLEGLILESAIYLGYFTDAGKLDAAKKLLSQSAGFISGFGAFRSRGYGRGTVSIEWAPSQTLPQFNPSDWQIPSPSQTCFLTSLVNVRNRPVNAEKRQTLVSANSIPSAQLRAWLVKTYETVFGVYPTAQEMASIELSSFYPAAPSGSRTCPPPMTTLKNELSQVTDVLETGDDPMPEQLETFFQTKSSPLDETCFVSLDSSPTVVRIAKQMRIRNAMETNFTTKKEGGLFVQEYLPAGQQYAGNITFRSPDTLFSRRIFYLLKKIKPVLNRALFDPWLFSAVPAQPKPSAEKGCCLVTEPVMFSDALFSSPDKHYQSVNHRLTPRCMNRITLVTVRRYNAGLNRPRRNRIAAAPGSVLFGSWNLPGLVSWQGFGKALGELKQPVKPEATQPAPGQPIKTHLSTISPSQAGQLREFLGPITIAQAHAVLRERLNKYTQWKQDAVSKTLIPKKR